MQQSLSSSWLVLAIVDIRYVVTIDECFQRAYYTGKMFRVLESFHHLGRECCVGRVGFQNAKKFVFNFSVKMQKKIS